MTQENTINSKLKWGGYILSSLASLFLLMDAVMKFVKPKEVVEGTVALGYNESVIVPLGIILLISTLLYIFPKTSVLGAILVTGYLGGAVATHVRIDNPLFTHILFPVYLGMILWLGLVMRNPKLLYLLPFVKKVDK